MAALRRGSEHSLGCIQVDGHLHGMGSMPPMPIRVRASVIQRNHGLPVCRLPRHKRHGGLGESPGGKVKAGG